MLGLSIMTFLPVVGRELRAAARRALTYWIRPLTAVVAIAVSTIFMMIAVFFPNPSTLGPVLFTTLSVYAFGLCLLAGIFMTADCVSEEVREGTLGFLFLTDLKGYDIVLGKFAARSLNAFYALLAVIPILGLPLLIGGVTGNEIFRMVLVLINALFLSLTAGVFVSARSRDAQKAMMGTLGLLIVITAGPTLIGVSTQWSGASEWIQRIAWCSPVASFSHALNPGTFPGGDPYWSALFTSHGCAWALMLWASLVLPRRWRNEVAPVAPRRSRWRANPVLLQNPPRHVRRDRALLDKSPILWLAERGNPRWQAIVWLLAVAIASIWLVLSVLGGGSSGMPFMMMATWIAWPFALCFKFLLAIQACRLFADARKTGTLEMLLTTPLTSSEILRGQWTVLKKTFLWPVVLVLASQALSFAVMCVKTWLRSDRDEAIAELVFSGFVFATVPKFITNLLAIACFGTYLSLTMKKPGYAAGLTILLAVLIPSLVPCLFGGILMIALDLVLILWPWTSLTYSLRQLALRHYAPPYSLVPAATARGPAPAR